MSFDLDADKWRRHQLLELDPADERVGAWVAEQVDHDDAAMGELAGLVAAGERPLAELVDAVDAFESEYAGALALQAFVEQMDTAELSQLRRDAGLTAERLAEFNDPHNVSEPFAQALLDLGIWQDPAFDEVAQLFGIDPAGSLPTLAADSGDEENVFESWLESGPVAAEPPSDVPTPDEPEPLSADDQRYADPYAIDPAADDWLRD